MKLNIFFAAQEFVEEIHRETQLPIHEKSSMFALLLTSHGDEGTIIGCDGKHVRLSDIYKLLSPANFPAMKKKPKLIIIQACAGGKCHG